MTNHKLQQLIKKGESQKVEFKTSLSLRNEIGETISAFANTKEGIVIIGVSDDGIMLGIDIGKKTVENLANWVKENTDPKIYPDLKVHKVNGKNIIEVSVKESEDKPVFFKNHAFQRVGKPNQNAIIPLSPCDVLKLESSLSFSFTGTELFPGKKSPVAKGCFCLLLKAILGIIIVTAGSGENLKDVSNGNR